MKKKQKQIPPDTLFQVNIGDYFEKQILSLKLTFIQSIQEQLHNSYDNRATNLYLELYDKNGNLIPINRLDEKTPYSLVLKDDCEKEIKSDDGVNIMKSLIDKENHNGLGFYNFGEIASIFNIGVNCMYVSKSTKFKIYLPNNSNIPVKSDITTENKKFLKSLNITKLPEKGTIKVFTGIKISITKEDIESISKTTSLNILYNNVELGKYQTNYSMLSESYNYKKSQILYGKVVPSSQNMEFYKEDSESGQYYKMKNLKNFSTTPYETKSIKLEKTSFDIKIEFQFSIYPEKTISNPNKP